MNGPESKDFSPTGLAGSRLRDRDPQTGSPGGFTPRGARDPGPGPESALTTQTLHASLEDPALASMNFLNEVGSRYPGAVSFASGRPCEEFFDVKLIHHYLDRFCEYLENVLGYSEARIGQTLFQYGRHQGDRARTDCPQPGGGRGNTYSRRIRGRYRGLSRGNLHRLAGAAPGRARRPAGRVSHLRGAHRGRPAGRHAGVAVRSGPSGVDVDDLAAQARRARAQGLRPRACYVMPDFSNPTGTSLSLADRHRLLAVAGGRASSCWRTTPTACSTTASTPPR